MKKEDITDWAQSPVTKALLKKSLLEIQTLKEAQADAYHPFDPQRTQEIHSGLNAAVDTWEIVQVLLQGDWGMFENEEGEIDDE